MANQKHLDLLKQGTAIWNRQREQHPAIRPDLSRANLSRADLRNADLSVATLTEANLSRADLSDANLFGARLSRARLTEATLTEATLTEATLIGADLSGAELSRADLSGADLSGADLSGAILSRANLIDADLSRADLSFATFVGTKLKGTTLTECHIYGISAWDVELTEAKQDSLVITPKDEPIITVDNLKVAQFIYLLLNNQEIRNAITTITTKVVLILGRFTPQREKVLDALRDTLRSRNYLPIVFDFEKPAHRNLTETISILAHMARFVIADITDAKSIPQELERIVPRLPSVPIQPLLQARAKRYGMFESFLSYDWVLEVYRYTTIGHLLASLTEQIIEPAEQKAQELEQRYNARTKLS